MRAVARWNVICIACEIRKEKTPFPSTPQKVMCLFVTCTLRLLRWRLKTPPPRQPRRLEAAGWMDSGLLYEGEERESWMREQRGVYLDYDGEGTKGGVYGHGSR